MSIYVDGIKVAGFAGRRGPAGPQGEPGVDGPPGVQGPPGADGLTPHIGANGNWWLGETDTGVSAAGGGGTGGVTSFNGRSGEVVPQAGDYTAADVGAATMEEVNAAIQEAMSGLHTITLEASPPEGGSVTGGGVAAEGMTVTVSAEPADQYHQFTQWQEGGEVVSMEAAYSFPVSGDRALTAVFGESWTPVWMKTNLPLYTYWNDVAYGNGKFVAVIDANHTAAAYSEDGITWTKTELPIDGNKPTIAYGNGLFVTVKYGSNKVIYSTDAINWEVSTLPLEGYWRDLTFGNGVFVLIPWSGEKAAYSKDGIIWMETSLPSGGMNAVAYGNGKFVAVGSNKIAYSSDGISWSNIDPPVSIKLLNIAYGNRKFIATAESGDKALISEDGITWEVITMPIAGKWSAIAYGRGKFMAAVGSGTSGFYSGNGITWEEVALPFSANSWNAIAYGNSRFIAVGHMTSNAAYTI